MKKLTCILLSTLLLISLAGCQSSQKHNETTVTKPTVTEPAVTQPSIPKPDVLELDAERQNLIQSEWHESHQARCGFTNDVAFCDLENRVDGIRYYGSFTRENYDGQVLTFDILYIPCESLPVASQFTIGEHTLRSRTGFGLYVFVSQHLSSLDITMNTFYPLANYVNSETGAPTIESDVLAVAVKMHSAYETYLYGSELSELPEEDPADSLLRLKAAWLLNRGTVPTFGERFGSRYYGTFGGYEIVFEPGQLTWVETQVIGGESFTYSYSFQLYAYKDWKFHKLKDVYDGGLISQDDIAEIAQIHREWKYEE